MFGFLKNLAETAISVAVVPVAMDIVTLGGEVTNTEACTPDAMENVVENIQKTIDGE